MRRQALLAFDAWPGSDGPSHQKDCSHARRGQTQQLGQSDRSDVGVSFDVAAKHVGGGATDAVQHEEPEQFRAAPALGATALLQPTRGIRATQLRRLGPVGKDRQLKGRVGRICS